MTPANTNNQAGPGWRLVSVPSVFPPWAKNATRPRPWSATTSKPWPSGTTTIFTCPGRCRPRRRRCGRPTGRAPRWSCTRKRTAACGSTRRAGCFTAAGPIAATSSAAAAATRPSTTAKTRRWPAACSRPAPTQADPCTRGFLPFYVYCWSGDGWHLSGLGSEGYRRLGRLRAEKTRLHVVPPGGLDLDHPRIAAGVHPRVF